MSDEYTPTTEQVRYDYAANFERTVGGFEDGWAGFNRWLAAHDAQVRAEVLAEVRGDLRAEAMVRAYSEVRTFTSVEVFDLAKRYTPEWVEEVRQERREGAGQ